MSTQETAPPTEPTTAPMSKNKRKKAAKPASPPPPPIEPIDDDESPYITNPYVYVEEGFSGWTVLRGLLGGFVAGGLAMTALFGYVRARELQRQQEEFIVLQAREEADRLVASMPKAEQPSSSV